MLEMMPTHSVLVVWWKQSLRVMLLRLELEWVYSGPAWELERPYSVMEHRNSFELRLCLINIYFVHCVNDASVIGFFKIILPFCSCRHG